MSTLKLVAPEAPRAVLFISDGKYRSLGSFFQVLGLLLVIASDCSDDCQIWESFSQVSFTYKLQDMKEFSIHFKSSFASTFRISWAPVGGASL